MTFIDSNNPIEINKDNRVQWIDTLKGFGIFLVFLGHIPLADKSITLYIYSFHMPLFFFIAGLFFKQNELSHGFLPFLRKKLQTRLVPYFLFGLLTYAIWLLQILLRKYGIYEGSQPLPESLFKPLIGMFYGTNGHGKWLIHNPNLWFLACLFSTEILFYCILLFIKRTMWLTIILIVFSWIGYLYSIYSPFSLPFCLDVAFTSIVFYGIAFLARDYFLYGKPDWKLSIIFIAIGIIFSGINGRIDMNGNYYGNYLLFYISSLSSICAYVSIMKYSHKNMLLSAIGKNSLVIFLLNNNAFVALNILVYLLTRIKVARLELSLPMGIAYAMLSIILLLPVSYLIKMKFSFLYGNIRWQAK